MALRSVLGVFRDLDTAVAATDTLHDAGFVRDDFEVLSNAPFPEGTFGHESGVHRLGVFPLVGACCGFSVGLLITAGTQFAYPIVTYGMPLFSIPPMVVIMYEGTLLAAVIFTVIGVLFESRLPRIRLGVYDPRITSGYIGIVVHTQDERVDAAGAALRQADAEDVIFGEQTASGPLPGRSQQEGAGA